MARIALLLCVRVCLDWPGFMNWLPFRYKFSVSYLVVHCGEVFDLLTNDSSALVNERDLLHGDFSSVEVRELEEARQLTALGSRKRVDLAVRLSLHASRRARPLFTSCSRTSY